MQTIRFLFTMLLSALAVSSFSIPSMQAGSFAKRIEIKQISCTSTFTANGVRSNFPGVVVSSWKKIDTSKSATQFTEGSFSIFNWNGYPAGLPKPTGPFRLLEGAEYSQARTAANQANAAMRKANPSLAGKQIHEIHPVKFSGSPTDPKNKTILSREQHVEAVNYWNRTIKEMRQQQKRNP